MGQITTMYLSPLVTDISGVTARWDAGWAEPVVLPVVLTAAALLALSGLAKLRNPRSAAAALEVAGLGGGPVVVRGLGAAELVVGSAAVLSPSSYWMLVLAALYAGFGGFLMRLKSINPSAGCGCMGDHSQPVGLLHIVADFVAAGTALFGWLVIAPGAHARIAASPLRAITFWLGIAGLAYLVYAVVRFLPVVFWPRRDGDRKRVARAFALTR